MEDYNKVFLKYDDIAVRFLSFNISEEMSRVGHEDDLVILEEDFKMMGHKKIQNVKFDAARKMVKNNQEKIGKIEDIKSLKKKIEKEKEDELFQKLKVPVSEMRIN